MKSYKWYLSKVRPLVIALIPGTVFRRGFKNDKHLAPIDKRTDFKSGIALFFLFGFFMVGMVLTLVIFPPLLIPLIGTLGATFVGMATLFSSALIGAEVGYLVGKNILRACSWLSYHNTPLEFTEPNDPNNPNLFNPTNPEKYFANHRLEEGQNEDNFNLSKNASQKALRLLCVKKSEEKDDPDGCLGGLSAVKQKKCETINFAVKFLQNNPTGGLSTALREKNYETNYINYIDDVIHERETPRL